MPPTDPPINRSMVDAAGNVQVYDIPDKKWKSVPFVDAREMQAKGTCSLHGPSVTMNGPGGQVVVCDTEVAAYQERGYTIVRQGPPQAPPPPAGRPIPPGELPMGDRPPGPERVVTQPPPGGAGAGNQGSGGGHTEPKPTAADFESFTVAELRTFAGQAKIENAGAMNKAALVQALVIAGFRPPAEE